MREMKDSGTEWIGNVPNPWTRSKIKNACSMIGSGTTPDSHIIEYYESGTINWIQSGDIYGKDYIKDVSVKVTDLSIKTLGALKLYKAPFITIAMYGGSVGNIAISLIDACANQACCCLRPANWVDFKYLFYWITFCKADFLSKAEGGGQPNISQDKIKNQWFYAPEIAEQNIIANYLEKKNSEYKATVFVIQAEIKTLEEYKQSIISEAVTKGLNRQVEMRESGIRWCPKIPVHWKTDRGKFILELLERPVCKGDGVITCFRDGEVTLRSNRREDGFTVSLQEAGYQGIDPGDLVVHGMDGFAGAIGISDSRGKGTPVLNVMDSQQNKRYLMYYLRWIAKIGVFESLSTGIRVRSCDTNWNKLRELPYIIPPIEEQNAIATYLDEKCTKIDEAIADKRKLLDILDNYKKSLIFEYVTGKKEVL